MRILLAFVFSLVFLTGCVSSTQTRRVSDPKGVHIFPAGLSGGVLHFVVVLADGELRVADSYVLSPRGKRYPFTLDESIEKGASSVYISLDDADRRSEASNGFWTFHVVFERRGRKKTAQVQRRLTLLNYSQPVRINSFFSDGGRTQY